MVHYNWVWFWSDKNFTNVNPLVQYMCNLFGDQEQKKVKEEGNLK